MVKPNTTDENCILDINSLISQYQSDLDKAKSDLDNRLVFPVGGSITDRYIDSYNQQITTYYNDYEQRANAGHCAYEFPKPSLLPATYSGPVNL